MCSFCFYYVAPLLCVFELLLQSIAICILLCLLIALLIVQVQEKKVKRVAVMNLDTSQSVGSIASTSSSKAPLPNGGCSDKFSCLNKDISFPPGGYPSLRFPVVSYTRALVIYY